jgi:UDP-N-acetylmuramyl pentapeptide phosphotransferase/UDP-N-acetylglucosamine-1-phosphate transferase|tara:strand:- start:415 stop:1434 length:1020 start_codon:yes stop_codon:yes gene_type:complete
MEYFLLSLIPIFIFIVNLLLKKYTLISNYSGESHQIFIGKKIIPLSGGIFLSFFCMLIFIDDFTFLSVSIFLIFLLGLSSDLDLISSPKLRLFLQSIFIFLFVYFSKLHVGLTRIYFLDLILDNILLSYFFTTFCLLIVINGTNFIDGLNGLVLGYYGTILIIIFKLDLINNLDVDENNFIYFIYLIFCLFLFNIFDQLYIGDSGAYLLGFIVGFFLIIIYQANATISPFYIILLLWYPCFENLFSIMRKFKFKKSPIFPDTKHLHQLLFYFIKKKFSNNSLYSNNLASFLILFYNIIIFVLASNYISYTQLHIFLIFLNMIVYYFFYSRLLFFRYKIK